MNLTNINKQLNSCFVPVQYCNNINHYLTFILHYSSLLAEKRDVYLTVQQAATLLDELPEPIADIVEFAIYTGFRKETFKLSN